MKSTKLLIILSIGLLLTSIIALVGWTFQSKSNQGEPTSSSAENKKIIRIGYQKYGPITLLKANGNLEKRLEPLGYSVKWTLFPTGPLLLEAMKLGSIDMGYAGEVPPVFAQAAGTSLVYIGTEPSSPKSEAIIVPKNSPIQSVAELKGKKVALNKGSTVHYLLVKALEKAGLNFSDIQPVYLPPADARAAFEGGSVDAWVIWDPYYAAVQGDIEIRVLADGTDLVANREYYLAERSFAEKNTDIVSALLEEANELDKWSKSNPREVAKILAPEVGMDVSALEIAAKRRDYGVQEISDQVIADQQKIADTFYKIGLIPKEINIKDAVLK